MIHWFRSFFNVKNKYLFISLFLSVFTANSWFTNQKLQISSFSHLIQGVATFENIDVNKRLSMFYISIFIIIAVFVACMMWSYFIDSKLGRFKILLSPWNKLAAIAVSLLFFKAIHAEQPFTYSFIFSVALTLLLFQVARYYYCIRLLLNTRVSFIWLSALSFSLCFLAREVIQTFTGIHHIELHLVYPVVFSFTLFLVILQSSLTKCSFRAIFLASLPFFAFPLLSVLCRELYLILNQHDIHFLSPNKFFGVMVIFCLLASIKLFFGRHTSKKFKFKKYLRLYIFPITLLGIVIFTFYKPIINQPDDLFELANPANAVMRLFNFHEVPIIQALSSHVLSDINFKLVYTFFNGYNGSLDFMIYDFIIKSIFMVITYFFFIKIFKNAIFVFILALFLPFMSFAIYGYHSLVFVTIFLIANLYKKYSFRKLLFIGLWNTFLICWKIEVGTASIVASMLLIGLYILKNYRKQLLADIVKVVVILFGSVLFIAILASLIWKIDVWGNFLQAKEYFGTNQAHGLPVVAYNQDRFYQYHYFIFPVLSILIFLFLLFKQSKDEPKRVQFLHLALLFLIVYYFVAAQRGLVRHSLAEGSDRFLSSYFYLILALFIFFLIAKHKCAKYIFVASFILTVHNFEFNIGDENLNAFEELSAVFQIPSEIKAVGHKINRMEGNEKFAKDTYSDFKLFMDTYFESKATFIDFSNTPMLYFYTKRRVPSYFNQYMQNIVSENLQIKNIEYLKHFDVPVVVFSNVPEIWWDNTDGVPNALRYNKIAQYIFENYEPLTIINKHYIWLKKGSKIAFPDSLKVNPAFVEAPKSFDLKKYPWILAKSNIRSSGAISCKSWTYCDSILDLTGLSVENRLGNYLMLKINNPNACETEAKVRYFRKGTESGTFKLTIVQSPKTETYLVPLSSQYNWTNQDIDRIIISVRPKENLELEQIQLFAKKDADQD